jgi:nucleotide-binding universal stress UspA family protein
MKAPTPIPTRTGAPAAADHGQSPVAPIIAALDTSAASRAAAEEAVILAAELEAPLVFVYVRRGPPPSFGTPFYERRLSGEMGRARGVLDRAVRIARVADVEADVEILEGPPKRRIIEFARDRGAQLVVLGSRRRRLRRSIAWAITRKADRPVVVAGRQPTRFALAHFG